MLGVRELGRLSKCGKWLLATYTQHQKALQLNWWQYAPAPASLDQDVVVSLLARRTHLHKLVLDDVWPFPGCLRALLQGTCPALQELVLHYGAYEEVGGMPLLAHALTTRMALGCKGLTSLTLATVVAGAELGEILGSGACERLQHINLSCLRDNAIAVLGQFLTVARTAELRSIRFINTYDDASLSVEGIVGFFTPGMAPNLEVLSLSQMAVGTAAMERMARAMETGAWPKLKELVVHPYPEADLRAQDVATLMRGIVRGGGSPSLERLRLCFTGDEGAVAVASALAVLPALTALELEGCGFGPPGARALGSAFAKKPGSRFRKLVVSQNPQLGNEGLLFLAAGLFGGAAELVELNLHNIGVDAAGAVFLPTFLERASSLQKLSLLSLDGGYEALRHVTEALKHGVGNKLTYLSVSTDDAGHVGASTSGPVEFFQALQAGACPWLEDLNIPGMKFGLGNPGLFSFAQALMAGAGRHLKRLNLNACEMSQEGLGYLSLALAKRACPNLHELLMMNNGGVGDQGILYLVKAFQNGGGAQLRTLNIRDTNMTDRGAEAMVQVLDSGACPCLDDLDFHQQLEGGAELTEAMVHALRQAVTANFRRAERARLDRM